MTTLGMTWWPNCRRDGARARRCRDRHQVDFFKGLCSFGSQPLFALLLAELPNILNAWGKQASQFMSVALSRFE